jgi:hypothetical protein
MKLVIFSCSPRPKRQSNSALIADAFRRGVEAEGTVETEVCYLYQRRNWELYRQLFADNTQILFVTPLFVECIPGILMEFLETLEPKVNGGVTTLSFIVQSGFEEAHQLRTCERYLEILPSYLNCAYGGTLIKGGMFALAVGSEKGKIAKLKPFFEMGGKFAEKEYFDKEEASAFAGSEYLPKSTILLIHIFKPINRIAWRYLARKVFKTQGRLDSRPYKV